MSETNILWDVFKFNVDHGVDPIEAFNAMVAESTTDLVGAASGGSEYWDDFIVPGYTLASDGTDYGFTSFPSGFPVSSIMSVKLPRTWVPGSNIVPFVYWSKTVDAGGDAQWQLEYKKVKASAVPDASFTLIGTAVNAPTGEPAVDVSTLATWGDQSFTSDLGAGDSIHFKLTRLVDDYYSAARLLEFGVHFKNTAGGSATQVIT